MGRKCISWRRVSTFKQNRSGLGLSAQAEIIRYFAERENYEQIADYAECYTGKELSGCVELRKAMAHAKRENAVLVIAKSDRFRNTVEALQIYEEMGDGNIMFCDLPHTDKFTLTLFFALAEREALIVSIRTKQALAVKKKQGCKLGAASETYRRNYELKSEEERRITQMKKGESKRTRHQESRDVQVFLRVLKRVQPEYCEADNPSKWIWGRIDTKHGRRVQMLGLMRDFKAMDETGNTFRKWDFSDIEERKLAVKLSAYLQSVRNSFIGNKIV